MSLLTNDELIEYLTVTAKVWIDGPEAQLMPQMTAEGVDGKMNLISLSMNGHPYDLVMSVAPMLWAEVQPVRVSLSTDTYTVASKFSDQALAADLQRANGQLSVLFAEGHPMVTEAVAFMIVTPETTRMVTLPYKRTDPIEWSDLHEPGGGLHGGRMVNALRHCLGGVK